MVKLGLRSSVLGFSKTTKNNFVFFVCFVVQKNTLTIAVKFIKIDFIRAVELNELIEEKYSGCDFDVIHSMV